MPPIPETEDERRDRELAELKARAQRLEIGLGAAVLILVALVVWAVFFRESPRPRPTGRGALLPGPTMLRAQKLL